MNFLYEFIQRIIKDLKLDNVAPTMQKTLELRIGEIVDKEIETALSRTLTPDDWKVYDEYLATHPDAKKDEAFDVMLKNRDEIQKVVEDTLANTYEDIILRSDIAKMVVEDEKKLES